MPRIEMNCAFPRPTAKVAAFVNFSPSKATKVLYFFLTQNASEPMAAVLDRIRWGPSLQRFPRSPSCIRGGAGDLGKEEG